MASNNQRRFSLFVLTKGSVPGDSTLLRGPTDKLITHYKDPISNDGGPHGNSRTWGDASLDVQRQVVTRLIERARESGYSDESIGIMLAIVQRESGFNPDAAAGGSTASGLGQFIDKTGPRFGLNDKNRFEIDGNIGAIFRIYDVESKNAVIRASESKEFAAFPKAAQIYALHHEGDSAPVSQLLTFLNDQKIDPTTGNPVYFNGPHMSGDALVAYAQNARMVLGRIEQEDNYVADALDWANTYPPRTNLTQVMQVEYDKARALQPKQPATFLEQYYYPAMGWGWDNILSPILNQRMEDVRWVARKFGLVEDTATYTVQSGDLLSTIAPRYVDANGRPLTWQDIARVNPDIDPNRIAPGQNLKLPPNVRLADGSSPGAASTASPEVEVDRSHTRGPIGPTEAAQSPETTPQGSVFPNIPGSGTLSNWISDVQNSGASEYQKFEPLADEVYARVQASYPDSEVTIA
jgi:nucleoid-associated protein YgaU